MSDNVTSRNFIIVARGPSAAVFKQQEGIRVPNYTTPLGLVSINFTTRWIKRENDITIPGHLIVEVSGEGTALNDVIVTFANAGLEFIPIISFCANAAISDQEIEIGFDNTKDVDERDYFQSYVPPESNTVHIFHYINVKTTIKVIETLAKHSETKRLHRGISQYQLSLNYWRLGQETLALAHLWMAVEAITKAKIRIECSKRGLTTEKQLAESFGVPKKQLDPTVRKMILEGDEECYIKGKAASDGFEHGFLDYGSIIGMARDIRFRMANFVRKSILDMMNLDAETYGKLVSDPYNRPIGDWPPAEYVRGKLYGKTNKLAKDGNIYPYLQWSEKIESVSFSNDQVNVKMKVTMVKEFGPEIEFIPEPLEVWKIE